ncbi:MAG: hypothetical protein ACO1RA_09805 [Planctomycetaceae bacterium]
MASGALPAAGPSGRPPASDVVNPTVSGIVHRQLDRTKLFVKLIDLGVLVAWAGAGLLGYFLMLAVVDHWVVSLGTAGRWLSLLGMLVGLGWLFAKGLAPLLLKRINPAYAAHTIEETMPAFKNSISTYLDLEQEKREVHVGILEAVGHKAARDIGAVEVDSVVDRSQLIRVGYVLVAIFASFAAYKILSPRDPLQTVARVLAPWADISRPSRVRILELSPGNKEVYYGDSVEVKVSLRGTHEGDEVRLVYSTADGQTVDRAIVMKAGVGNVDYTATLPASETAGSASQGIQQDLIYRVEAGDAVSNSYRLSVISAPTILVKRLSYSYPAYMKKAAVTVDSQGDISAPEGTKVTIEATANVPIATAVLEMDPVDGKPAATLEMSVEGQNARGGLQLLRDRDGNPKYRHYQVRITTSDGQKNSKPILHAIEVTADLPPEATILSPEELVHEVPLDGVLPVEVRAVDPDFGLTSVRIATLQGEQEQVLSQLLKEGSPEVPQFTGKGELSPAKLKMKVGDELTFFAVASDNRHDVESGNLRPNVGRSVGHVLRVVAPDGATKPEEKTGDEESEGVNKPKEDGGDDMNPMTGTSREDMPPKTADKPMDEGANNNSGNNDNEDKTNESGTENKGPENPGENSVTEKGSSSKENSGKNDKKSKGNSSKKEDGSKEKSEGSNSEDSGNKEEGSSKQQDNKNKTGNKESKTGSGEGKKENEPKSPMNKASQGNSGSKEKSGEKNSDKSKKNGGKENSSGGSASSGSKEKGEKGKEKQGGSSKQQEGATQDKSGGGEDAEGSPMGNSPQSGDSQSGEEGAGPTTGEAAGNSETPSGRKGADSQDATGAASGTDSTGGSGGSGADKPAGDHDGEKFDRILEHIKQKQGGKGSDSGTRNENSRIERSKNQSTENRNLKEFEGDVPGSPRGKEAKGNPNPSEAKEAEGDAPSGAKPTNPMEGNSPEGTKEKGTSGRNKEGKMNPGEKGKLPGTSGEKEKGIGGTEPQTPEKAGTKGSEGTGNDASQKEKEKKGGNSPESQSPERNPGKASKNQEGGDGGANKPSTAGSGTPGDPKNGAKEEGLNKDTPKDPTENRNDKNTGELSGPSKSKKQSNAKSSTSGPESGQGSQGGGQQANQAGKGAAGSNQSDDDGAGASKEKGVGEDGVNAGKEKIAEGATGRPDPNKQKGSGSSTRSTDSPMGIPMNGEGGKEGEGASGAGPMPPEGGKQGKAPSGKQGTGANPMTPGGKDDGSDDASSNETATAEGSPAKSANPKGPPSGLGAPGKTGQGGAPMEGSPDAAASATESGEVPDGDAANLDYTRKATSMALDYLKDQEHNPDPDLLKELNWTEADLKNFLKRWESLSEESKADATKKHELDEALRSLGLSAPTARKRQGGKASDAVRGIGDGQSRVAPPSRYRDQFEAFRSRQGK